jgi:Sulfotransferase family
MPAAIARASHVFIAGLPRTGSTLTHRILNRSPEVRLAGETHFLGARTLFGRRNGYADRYAEAGDLTTDAGLERVVTAVYASRGKSFWSRFATTVERQEFERLLHDSDRSRRALFDAAMRAFAQGRPVAGDKTPEHIDAVPTLLSWFPEARVVHTFRDPRAIYVSLRRKERADTVSRVGRMARLAGPLFEIYASTSLALRWRSMARRHRRYAAAYPGRYTLQRFEDLLADPAAAVKRLCEFIGIEFDPGMLEQVVHNSSYAPKKSGAGIDQSTAERWREHLPKATERWLSLLCGRELANFGYER